MSSYIKRSATTTIVFYFLKYCQLDLRDTQFLFGGTGWLFAPTLFNFISFSTMLKSICIVTVYQTIYVISFGLFGGQFIFSIISIAR